MTDIDALLAPLLAELQQVGPTLWIALGAGALLALAAARRLSGLRRDQLAAQTAAQEAMRAAAAQHSAEIAALAAGQQQLAGALSQGLAQSGDIAARAQGETLRLVEARLDAVTSRLDSGMSQSADRSAVALSEAVRAMEARLVETQAKLDGAMAGSAEKTAQSLGALTERLEAIDRAQTNIEKLSGDVLGLQDILANKQARGRFGEIQLNDLIIDALPPTAYAFQATLSNGRRVDALLKLPDPPGPVAVDAKFPLEPFDALRQAQTPEAAKAAESAIRQAVRAHVANIAERYVAAGETADGALMFLPSEAIYAELHARFPELVREGFAKRVWIVSPTTLMATLLTMRAVLRDAQIRERSSDLRREIGLLAADVERLASRAEKLRGHVAQSDAALREIGISAEKAVRRARRLNAAETDLGAERSADDAIATTVSSASAPRLAVDAAGEP